jgi:toluene monooxygenase system protein E
MTRLALPYKTYSHLAGARRVPSEYEVTSTGLHYYVAKGMAVAGPAAAWHRRFQAGSALTCQDWSVFRDPRETTYAGYNERQSNQEMLVASLAEAATRSGLDQSAGFADWEQQLAQMIGPARFVAHGFQMMAAYVGQLAPEARVTIVALFQAADELRRIHHLAFRLAQLRARAGASAAQAPAQGTVDPARAAWQEAPAWQPLRRVLETALTAYDWGEALVALNLCLKPAVDGLLLGELARTARASGDFPFGEILASLEQDAAWHADWTDTLVRLAVADRPANRPVIAGWIARWLPPAEQAVMALAETLWAGQPGVADRLRGPIRRRLAALELAAP